jgi:hypothetical protein
MNAFQKEMDVLEKTKLDLSQNMLKGFTNMDDIQNEIDDKKHRMNTCSISP